MSPERRTGSTPRHTTHRAASHAQDSASSQRAQSRPQGSVPQQRAQGRPASATRRTSSSGRTSAASHAQGQRRTREGAASSHVRTGAPRRASHMNAQSVDFSSSRRSKRAARGEVRNVVSADLARSSKRSHAMFASNKGFAQEIQRTAKVKRFLAVLLAVLAVVAVGFIVGMVVFFSGLSSQFALSGQDSPTNLATVSQGSPYYVVVSADLDESDGCDTDVDALALVRVDPNEKKMALISVPTNLSVKLSDGSSHAIREAVSVGGNTELVNAVASLTGVGVSHFVRTDEAGIRSIVTAMGGLTLHLSEEVDDPNAGYIYIPAGQQTLNADQAMTFLRASNYKNGETTMEENQTLAIAMVVEYLSQGTQADTSSRLDGIAGSFQADWSGQDLVSAFASMSGFKAADAYRDSVPCYATSTKDDALYVAYDDSLKTLMSSVDSGDYTAGVSSSLADIVPGAYTVTVRNGSGITGGATTIANILSGVGFQIAETGNADSFVYNETLVVYGNDSLKEAAQAAVSVLGIGRATEAGVYYTYDSDLLVILGSDWKPLS